MSLLETVTIKFTPAGSEEVESYYRKLANKIKNIAKGQQTSLGLSVADIKQLSNETTKSYNNQKNQIKQLERERTLANKKALVDLKAIDREDKVITAQKIANIKMTQRWEEAYSKQAVLNSKKQLQQDISNIRLKEAANKNNLKQALVNSKLQLQQDLSNIRIKEAAEKAYLKSVQDLERSIRRQSEAEARRLATARNKSISGLGVTSQQLGLKEFSGVNLTSGVNAQRVAELQAKYNNLNQVMLNNGRITQSVFDANKLAIEKFSMSTVKAADKLKTGLTKEVGLMRSTFINLTRAFIAFQIASGFINLTKQIDTLSRSFRALKSSVGYADIKGDLEAVSRATGGAVSQYTSAGAINRAQMMGVDLSEGRFQEIATATTKIASIMGSDPTQMFADFTTAIAKASPIILDNSGIILKLEESYKVYYDRLEGVNVSYDKWVNKLTQQEKNDIYRKIGTERLNEKVMDMEMNFSKLTLGMGKLSEAYNKLMLRFEDSYAIDLVIKAFSGLIGLLDTALSKLDKAIVLYKQAMGEFASNTDDSLSKQLSDLYGSLQNFQQMSSATGKGAVSREIVAKNMKPGFMDTAGAIGSVLFGSGKERDEYLDKMDRYRELRDVNAEIAKLEEKKNSTIEKQMKLQEKINNVVDSGGSASFDDLAKIEEYQKKIDVLSVTINNLAKGFGNIVFNNKNFNEEFIQSVFKNPKAVEALKTVEGQYKKGISKEFTSLKEQGIGITPDQKSKINEDLKFLDKYIASTSQGIAMRSKSIEIGKKNIDELISNQNRWEQNDKRFFKGIVNNAKTIALYDEKMAKLIKEYERLDVMGEDVTHAVFKIHSEMRVLAETNNDASESTQRVSKALGIGSMKFDDLIKKYKEYVAITISAGSQAKPFSRWIEETFVKADSKGVSKIKDLLKEWLDIKREAEKALMGSQRREIADAEDIQRDRIDRLNELFKSLKGVSRQISTISFDKSAFGTTNFYQNLDKMEQSIKSLSPELLKQMYKVDANELNNIISNLKIASKNILEKISEENQRKIAEIRASVRLGNNITPELDLQKKGNAGSYLENISSYINEKGRIEKQALWEKYDEERKLVEKNVVDKVSADAIIQELGIKYAQDLGKINSDNQKEKIELEKKYWDIARNQQQKYWEFWDDASKKIGQQRYELTRQQVLSPETTTVKSRFGTFSSQQGMFTDQKEALANLYSNATPEFQRFVSLTNDGLEKTREYFTDLSESGRKEIDLLIEALDNLSLKASEPFEFLKNVAKEALMSTAQAISQYAWQSTIGFTDMQTAAKEDRRVAIADLQEQRNQNMVDEATYKNKLATIEENYAIKQVQYEKQARKQLLLGLGQQFYAKGTGYLIDSVVSFARGNIARGGAEALAGTAMIGLGAGLGYAGASITVPQASSNSDAANSGGKDQYFNINANLFEDKLQFGRVGSKTIIRG